MKNCFSEFEILSFNIEKLNIKPSKINIIKTILLSIENDSDYELLCSSFESYNTILTIQVVKNKTLFKVDFSLNNRRLLISISELLTDEITQLQIFKPLDKEDALKKFPISVYFLNYLA